MSNTITYTSQLMDNYVQAELMSPESTFEALQTSTGNSLLFSIGTDSIFYVTEETSGQSSTGWVKTDLSSAVVSKNFSSGATCSKMSVAQNTTDGTIGLGMALSTSTKDNLYLCMGNSNSDTSWIDSPSWTAFPYDYPDGSQPNLKIVNIFISEVQVNSYCPTGQYIVVDVERNPSSSEALIDRYYIDTQKTEGYAWQLHDISIDIEAGSYQSCTGRVSNGYIDGIYTAGVVAGSAQFVYTPIFNIYSNTAPPSSNRLLLPGGITADSFAACRNSDESTDLYVAASGALYYFASTNQKDESTGVLLMKNTVFTDVSNLYVYSLNGTITVWGLNSAGEIFYTSCPATSITASTSQWSLPLPILTGVDMVSPYVNCVNNGNTIFAVAESTLYILTKSPQTTIWKTQQITLPAPSNTTTSTSFSSYTTQITITDEYDQPVANTAFSLSATTRTNFYINNLYTVLDTISIPVNTDNNGVITLIEAVSSLQCAQITIADTSGSSVQINPMDTPFQQVVELDTTQSLSSAVITNTDGSTTPLVAAGTSSSNLQAVATSNQSLSTAYSSVTGTSTSSSSSSSSSSSGSSNAIVTDYGDLSNWLKTGVKYVVSIVKDVASDAWNFIAEIAGQAYSAVLDCVEKIVSSMEWVFNAIGTLITDLIDFLKFLFDVGNIIRTKNVIKNLITLFIENQISGLATIQQQVDSNIESLESQLSSWASQSWSGLGSSATSTSSTGSTPTKNSSASNSLVSHHFQHNAGNGTLTLASSSASSSSTISDLLNTLSAQNAVIGGAASAMASAVGDFNSLTLEQMLQQMIAILADSILTGAQAITDSLTALLTEFADLITGIFSSSLYVPVVSDILTAFGMTEPTVLEIFSWLAAVPVTIVYELLTGSAPFPDNSETTSLINATSYDSVLTSLGVSSQSSGTTSTTTSSPSGVTMLATVDTTTPSSAPSSSDSSSGSTNETLFIVGHTVCSFFKFINTIVGTLEAASPTGDNPFAAYSAVLSVMGSGARVIANEIAPKDPETNTAVAVLSDAITGYRIMVKLLFCGPAQKAIFGTDGSDRSVGASIDAALVMFSLTCSVFHFIELAGDTDNETRSLAILEETGNLMSYTSRVSYTTLMLFPDNEYALAFYTAANACSCGIQMAEVVVAAS